MYNTNNLYKSHHMKRMMIISLIAVISIIAAIVSCGSSDSWELDSKVRVKMLAGGGFVAEIK